MKAIKDIINTAYADFENKNFDSSLSFINEAEDVILKAECCSLLEENVRAGFLSSIYDFRGFIYLGLNNINEAENSFEKSINTNPQSTQALVGLAEVSYLNDRIEAVEKLLLKINEIKVSGNYISEKLVPVEFLIKSKIFQAMFLRRELDGIRELIEKNEIGQAEEAAMVSLLVLPDNPELLNNLSVILAMQNRCFEAVGIIEKILMIDPENQTALENLETIRGLANNEPENKLEAISENMNSNLEYWKIMQDNGYFENHIFYGSGSGSLPLIEGDLENISKYVELNTNMNVAVIGCGYGRESVIIGPHVKHVFGIDVNEKILEKAAKFTSGHGVNNFTPVLAETWEENIKEEIDFVYEMVVFQHLTRYLTSEYIRGMSNKLSKNGKMLCQFLQSSNGTNDAELAVYEPEVSWTIPQIEELARENDLLILRSESFTYPFCSWHWVLFGK